MLHPSQFSEGLQPAPAYGLIFKNVEYDNITWNEDKYAKRIMSKTLDEMFLKLSLDGCLVIDLENHIENYQNRIYPSPILTLLPWADENEQYSCIFSIVNL
jgi:hypothetical protein